MKVIVFWMLFILASCAGPSNPFGSNLFVSSEFVVNHTARGLASASIEVKSNPPVKLYNTPYDLKIHLKSNNVFDKSFRYEIIYNNKKLDRWWTSEDIKISPNKKEATISFNQLSLIPGVRNEIYFLFYPNSNANPITYKFKDPYCNFKFKEPIIKLSEYNNGPAYTQKINYVSIQHNVNSFLLASLVAQESSFNPKAVSWAKAIGLTQVTPLANQDIIKIKTSWASYPNINRMSYIELKYKIANGHINGSNDWRLDTDKSLEGGAIFLNELEHFWNQKDTQKLLTDTFDEIPYTDIILASYNSGATRVKRNIKSYNKQWLWAKELKEARKYVMNIKSYCHQFKQKR